MSSPFCYNNFESLKSGIALIFNHEKFKDLKERTGTEVDKVRLLSTLRKFGFETRSYEDLTYIQLSQELEKVSKEDHENNCCLIIFVLTHGDPSRLWAFDKSYGTDELFEPFYGDNSHQSLIGKPKLFFIQACRGTGRDSGSLKFDDSYLGFHSIPTTSDFFIMYSSSLNYVSIRNEWTGSWFIESFYKELEKVEDRIELTHLTTNVSWKVAEKWSKEQKTKQQPVSCSTLRKLFYFIKLKE